MITRHQIKLKYAKKTKGPNEKGILGWWLRLWYFIKVMLRSGFWVLNQFTSSHPKLEVIPKRPGDIAVVTGGARGIGLAIVKQLLEAEMRVIVGCRNVTAGEKAILAIRNEGFIKGTAECLHLDLLSLKSVREFAKRIVNQNFPIQILINNAAVMFQPYELSSDGFEAHFQIIYLGHFLLTHLLLPSLVKGGTANRNSRVVNVSSIVHYMATINFDDFLMQKVYSSYNAYNCAKLMQVISSRYMNSRYEAENLPVRSYCIRPGVIKTNLTEHMFGVRFMRPIMNIVFQKTEKGADRVVYCALSPDMENQGGTYSSYFKIRKPNPDALNPKIQERLWKVTCDLLKLDKDRLKISVVSNLKSEFYFVDQFDHIV